MKKNKFLESRRKPYIYTAYTSGYSWSTTVYSHSIKAARQIGYSQAVLVMGNHSRIIRDEVRET